jgi:ABC-type dipeptide/oligopeptide/nickel transport system ATPase component
MQLHERKIPFVAIRSSLFVLERIACSVKHNEPVLLVGETGTGKTTLVQNLALMLGQKLTVLVCCILLYYFLCYLKLYQGFLGVRHDAVYFFSSRT